MKDCHLTLYRILGENKADFILSRTEEQAQEIINKHQERLRAREELTQKEIDLLNKVIYEDNISFAEKSKIYKLIRARFLRRRNNILTERTANNVVIDICWSMWIFALNVSELMEIIK